LQATGDLDRGGHLWVSTASISSVVEIFVDHRVEARGLEVDGGANT
jgi:hypothetical protein